MPNKCMPDTVIIVSGPVADIARGWLCINKSGIIVYCTRTDKGCYGCSFKQISEEEQED